MASQFYFVMQSIGDCGTPMLGHSIHVHVHTFVPICVYICQMMSHIKNVTQFHIFVKN